MRWAYVLVKRYMCINRPWQVHDFHDWPQFLFAKNFQVTWYRSYIPNVHINKPRAIISFQGFVHKPFKFVFPVWMIFDVFIL